MLQDDQRRDFVQNQCLDYRYIWEEQLQRGYEIGIIPEQCEPHVCPSLLPAANNHSRATTNHSLRDTAYMDIDIGDPENMLAALNRPRSPSWYQGTYVFSPRYPWFTALNCDPSPTDRLGNTRPTAQLWS